MRIYPVLDIKNGVAVHAVRGDRKRYAPLKSRLTQSSDPLVVARAMRAQLGLNELYIADLDALQGHAPANLALASTLEEDGFQLLLDAGVADVQSAQQVRKAGVDQVIVALETLPDPKCLGEIVRELGDDSVLFSLDLKDGVPLGDTSAWEGEQPAQLAAEAYEIGVRRMIVLDLAQVGSGDGPAHLPLLRELRRELPETELITGGGVRTGADLDTFKEVGVSGVLVATALHSGALDFSG